MLDRKITKILLEWKRTKLNECLLIKGARQIGKTFIIDRFGRENYGSYIYLNFIERPDLRDIFDGELSVSEILRNLSLRIPGVRYKDGDTLLFFDEIQVCPEARTALKFFALDGRYDVIASGSMLGINYKELSSIPVGYERQIEMFSLDFEEFLWAIGIAETAVDNFHPYFERCEPVPVSMNETMMKYLRQYIVVGGMPAVVNRFIASNNFGEVHGEQQKIIDSYLDDIAKYATTSEKPKARNCYLSVSRQLARESRKFQYSVVERGGSARKYENSLEWLRDAGLIKFCYNVTTPIFPLNAYVRGEQYKIYLTDIGILTAMYGFDMKTAIIENTLTGPAKGGIYENLVADFLMKNGVPLMYYKTDNNTQEIEFLLTKDAKIIPVEVKSSNGRTVSLNEFIAKFSPPYGIKLTSGNAGMGENKRTFPLYMGLFL